MVSNKEKGRCYYRFDVTFFLVVHIFYCLTMDGTGCITYSSVAVGYVCRIFLKSVFLLCVLEWLFS